MKGENVMEIESDVKKKFDISVHLVRSLPQSASFQPSYSEQTKIYSYFKQSKFGACSIPRPGFWDVINRAKWDAWSALGNMLPDEAMKHYVEEIKKVYHRIKDNEAFEEKHIEFAEVLIPFCQITGTQLTNKLMEIVKQRRLKDEETKVNGFVCTNGNSHSDEDNGAYLKNNEDNSTSVKNNEIITINGNVESLYQANNSVNHITKSVKFQINDNNNDILGDSLDKNDENSLIVEIEETVTEKEVENVDKSDENLSVDEIQKNVSEKEEGELSTSVNDSEEEIYCDSLDPDQIRDIQKDLALSIVTSEPSLFSPLPSADTLQVTNVEPQHTLSSSGNSPSDFELTDLNMGDKNAFQSVRKGDAPSNSCNMSKELQKPLHRKRSKRKTLPPSVPLDKTNTQANHLSAQSCHCGVRMHKRDGHHASNQNHRHENHTQSNGEHSTNTNNVPNNTHSNGNHHSRQNHTGNSDGSNNDGSDDDSGSSTSSSASDNIGLKIVKALERMDDNMHLILNRLDSIDTSMKVLAKPPEPPWWVKHMPSRFTVLSTLWPIIVNLIFIYLWRRKRWQRRKLLKVVDAHVTEILPSSSNPSAAASYL